MKILTVLGARPQFIKAAMVSRAISGQAAANPELNLSEEIVHTGQHFDANMSSVFFEEMGIPAPVSNLGIAGGSHGEMTARMLQGLEREILARTPDLVLVYGDTNSTLAGALAAAKLHVPVAHVEAGLRSFNRAMPEEINRILTDHVSAVLLCPTERAAGNLAAEGIRANVHVVGDVMYDATEYFLPRARDPEIEPPFALATIHRPGNTDSPARLGMIFRALAECPVPVLLPLHPRTRQALEQHGVSPTPGACLQLREPMSYLEMLGSLRTCAFVLTDSGGLQKEAYFCGKRCLTLRPETEWTELVDSGWNRLVEPEELADSWSWAMSAVPGESLPLYGTGDAAERIVSILVGSQK